MGEASLKNHERSLFISAGDISGDIHAGGLIQELKKSLPEHAWYGLGGHTMEEAGCRLLEEPEKETVMGFKRVLARLPHYFSLLARIAEFLKSKPPELVILVDYPGLNQRIAKIARSLGIPTVYFICPQFWAWAPWRIRKFSKRIDLALVIFPFEEAYFSGHGIATRYIGHPACDRAASDQIEGDGEADLPEGDLLALLPGSRRQEMHANLPIMLKSAHALCSRYPGLTPVLSHYSTDMLDAAGKMANEHGVDLQTIRGGMRRLAGAARLCMVGSGTATLEVAFSRTPMVVVYRTSKMAYRLAPYLLTVPYICQVNLMAGRELVPELLLHEDDPAPLLSRAVPLLEDGEPRERMLADLDNFKERHFKPGAIRRAAESILDHFNF
jgi:lipid-A-disaccharide synthase